LFVEHGIDGTSVRAITERAGVTEGALYRHHAGKDALVRALFFGAFEQYAAILARARASEATLPEKLRAMISAIYRGYDEDPKAFRFVLLVQHGLLDEVRRDMANPVDVLQGLLEEGMAAGEIPAQDAALAAQLVLGLVMQVPVGHRYGRVTGPVADYAGTVASACVAVLGRPH
jgi:AcrR family transcriptional regulator